MQNLTDLTNSIQGDHETSVLTPAHSAIFSLTSRSSAYTEQTNPRSLIIGTHTEIPLVGNGMLSSTIYGKSEREIIQGSPQAVLEQLRELARQHRHRFACVIAAFEMHHFKGSELRELMELLNQVTHDVAILCDYSFLGCAAQEVEPNVQYRIEQVQQAAYGGFSEWFVDHAVFSPASFLDVVREGGWKSMHGLHLPEFKTAAISSSVLTQYEIDEIVRQSVTPSNQTTKLTNLPGT